MGRVFLGAFLLADPLLALNSLVNGPLRWEMLLAIPLLLLPLVLGRAFCGYVCPMGTVIELLGPRRAPARERRGWARRGDAGAEAAGGRASGAGQRPGAGAPAVVAVEGARLHPDRLPSVCCSSGAAPSWCSTRSSC